MAQRFGSDKAAGARARRRRSLQLPDRRRLCVLNSFWKDAWVTGSAAAACAPRRTLTNPAVRAAGPGWPAALPSRARPSLIEQILAAIAANAIGRSGTVDITHGALQADFH
jgi:hypothetical protein